MLALSMTPTHVEKRETTYRAGVRKDSASIYRHLELVRYHFTWSEGG